MIVSLVLCCDGDGGPVQPRTFLFAMRGSSEEFVAITSDPGVLSKADDQLARFGALRDFFIIGPIARGNGGHNLDWSWHFVPDTWDLKIRTDEECDGTPGDVESEVDRWVDDVGQFCPSNSFVSQEL
jgi:hypothetical protein